MRTAYKIYPEHLWLAAFNLIQAVAGPCADHPVTSDPYDPNRGSFRMFKTSVYVDWNVSAEIFIKENATDVWLNYIADVHVPRRSKTALVFNMKIFLGDASGQFALSSHQSPEKDFNVYLLFDDTPFAGEPFALVFNDRPRSPPGGARSLTRSDTTLELDPYLDWAPVQGPLWTDGRKFRHPMVWGPRAARVAGAVITKAVEEACAVRGNSEVSIPGMKAALDWKRIFTKPIVMAALCSSQEINPEQFTSDLLFSGQRHLVL
jgi:hypothetical protein